MVKKSITLTILITLYSAFFVNAEPGIRAHINSDAYNIGSIIPVDIDVTDNIEGFHSIYFDLSYDGSVLAFDSIDEGLMIHRISDENRLLYAIADDLTANSIGNHIVVSFTLEDKSVLTKETGNLATIRFRVINPGTPGDSYMFSFFDNGIKDNNENLRTKAVWEDTDSFTILSSSQNNYIQIRNPYDNQVFYEQEIEVDAIFTESSNYYVILQNSDTSYISGEIDGTTGAITGEIVELTYGFNRISALLYDNNDILLAKDEVRVLRSEDDKYIKIISPEDHELINTDMIDVRVSTYYGNVMINGVSGENTGEKDGDNVIFRRRLWLKEGFNSIEATSISGEGAVYKDTIDVYYHKDNNVFRFINPGHLEVFKTGENVLLKIKGEIGSQYKSQSVRNTVTLKVIYTPDNSLFYPRILVNNREARITETDIVTGGSRAPYMFFNDFDISLTDLESGEIEIIAYKNKIGTTWENEIHRIVKVDNNKLAIQLVQPNVYSYDILNTMQKLYNFNDGQIPELEQESSPLYLNDDGSITLKKTLKYARKNDDPRNPTFGNNEVVDFIETRDKSLYALVNENFGMKIYKKQFGSDNWEKIISRDDMYGYDICETELGILIGVSNLFTSGYTGLYLLNDDNKLINIIIGQPIPDVQFIVNNDGQIYLYGNDYSHLYSFNIFSLEDTDTGLTTTSVTMTEFSNNLYLNQFELSNDGKTAVLRDRNNRVYFYVYNNMSEKFIPEELDLAKYNPNNSYIRIIAGNYADGDYNAYLLIDDSGTNVIVVMEHKETHRLLVNKIDHEKFSYETHDTLCGIDFADDNFVFLFQRTDGDFVLYKSQVLFDEIYQISGPQYYNNEIGTMYIGNLRLYSTGSMYYIGIGNDIPEEKREVYKFINEFESYGEAEINYINGDIDGLTGFQFEVDSIWLTDKVTEGIDFGFTVLDNDQPVTGYNFDKTSLQEFVDSESDYYSITSQFDSLVSKEIIRVFFNELLKDKTLSFQIGMYSIINNSPALSNLTINKKIPVKIPKSDKDTIYLPIHGYVYDSTVDKVFINEVETIVEKNRSFSYNYPINSSKDTTTINLHCSNRIGDKTELSFFVQIFESINTIWEIEIDDKNNIPLQDSTPLTAEDYELHTDTDIIKISGKYYGLFGAVCGYELYDYVYDDNGDEELVIVRNGIFGNHETYNQIPGTWTLPEGEENPGPGFIFGQFIDQEIELVPGEQLLKIFVENPGGLRTEYFMTENNYPHIIYNLPADQQEIKLRNLDIYNLSLDEQYIIDDVTINKTLDLDVYEASDLHFKKVYVIEGEIKSLYNFTDIKVKSLDPGVTFDNNKQEIVLPVDNINRFLLNIHITMDDEGGNSVYNLLFIPTKPVFQWMRTGLRINALKDFRNTHIIPDFSLMEPWDDGNVNKKIKIKIINDRYIPENAEIQLLVNFNFDEIITGYLVKVFDDNGNYYRVKIPEEAESLTLTGVKPGRNRVQWKIFYDDDKIISSSINNNKAMNDYIFTIPVEDNKIPTYINFPIQLQYYYNSDDSDASEDLPDFELTKDPTTYIEIYLNKNIFKVLNEDENNYTINTWKNLNLKEGKNYIEVYIQELGKELKILQYIFLYDSLTPEIKIDSFSFDFEEDEDDPGDGTNYLLELTALVTEANLDKVNFYYHNDSDIMENSILYPPVKVTYIGEDMYRVKWYDLKKFEMIPTTNYKITVKAFDHSGKENEADEEFVGLAKYLSARPPFRKKIDMSGQYENFPYYPKDDGTDPYGGHIKFFGSSINLLNADPIEPFRHERYNNIGIGEETDPEYDGNLILKAGETINFKKGFEIRKGATLDAGIIKDEYTYKYKPSLFRFVHDVASKEETSPLLADINGKSKGITFLFQFRDEFESFYQVNSSVYRRVFTLYDYDRKSIYLAMKDNDDHFYLIDDTGSSQVDILKNNDNNNGMGVEYNITYEKGEWNTITLAIQELDSKFYIAVNDAEPVTIEVPNLNQYIKDILKQNHEYYFGSTFCEEGSTETVDTGHYSIARVFYINEVVETSTAVEQLLCYDEDSKKRHNDYGSVVLNDDGTEVIEPEPYRTYNFNNVTDDVGDAYYKLRINGDHFSPYENANYSQNETYGSLKVSSDYINALHINENNQVCFGYLDNTEVENPILINLNADYSIDGGNAMALSLKNDAFIGRYFFNNKYGTHGLGTNKWYSVSGYVRSIEDPEDKDKKKNVTLVMRINNNEQLEQSMELKAGDFHFVYQHDTNIIVESITLFIETNTTLVIDKNMMVNEGDYALPPEGFTGLIKSNVSTKYIFFPKGTVDFWYKPFNVNHEGYVSYDLVFFDGGSGRYIDPHTGLERFDSYVQIGAKVKQNEKYAKFFVKISDGNDKFIEHSDVLVKEGWQHIQFTYNSDEDTAYLYIDGNIAIKYEDLSEDRDIPEPPAVTPGIDNVYLGSSGMNTFFCQGYLDEMQFSNLYYGPLYDHKAVDPENADENDDGGDYGLLYNKYNPIHIYYTDFPHPDLVIEFNDPEMTNNNVSNIEYCLDAKDRFFLDEKGELFRRITKPDTISAHGMEIDKLPSGTYLFRAKMVINGHRFRRTYSFVKNDKPLINVKAHTPLVIKDKTRDIIFNLEYDGSYLLNTRETIYAGFALRLKKTLTDNDQAGGEIVNTFYVTQDFLNNNKYNKKWFVIEENELKIGNPHFEEILITGDTIDLTFQNVTVENNERLEWDLRPFYFEETLDDAAYDSIYFFDNLGTDKSGEIEHAYYTYEIMIQDFSDDQSTGLPPNKDYPGNEGLSILYEHMYEYRLDVTIGNSEQSTGGILNTMSLKYVVIHNETKSQKVDFIDLKGSNKVQLYYDDILISGIYGEYTCKLSLVYEGEEFGEEEVALNWKKVTKNLSVEKEKSLSISDFSLLYLDKINNYAKLYLEYNHNNINDIIYDLIVYSTETGRQVYSQTGDLLSNKNFKILDDVYLSDGACYIKISVTAVEENLISSADLQVVNSSIAPTIALTNTIESLIAYNNVMFSWKGYHEGEYKPDIEYTYNFDYKGWTAPTNEWKKIEFYNLNEGYHNFRVKAVYNGEESSEESVTFFVDVNRPQFNPDKILVEKIYDDFGIAYAVDILGSEGAINDSSLNAIQINGIALDIGLNGSFSGINLPLEYDGGNVFIITAFDRVGNFTDHTIIVHNPLTSIIYPDRNKKVKFSPMTLVGKISDEINVKMDIYIFDPKSEERGDGDYSGWKKAKINEDRKFFIEDIFITPGNSLRDSHTPLEMKVIVQSGKTFKRSIDVYANQIIMPIELTLSTHAVEGENVETAVRIDCKANVDNISSWSIDYNGDGIYDTVDMVDNSALGHTHQWTHSYSSLGLVTPRVRVITNDGYYFSVTDQLIIHERIKEASNLNVADPISMSSVRMDDNSKRIYVLAGKDNFYSIYAYEVGRNEKYISDRLFTISLEGLGIDNPVAIKARNNENLFIASNRNGRGTVYLLKANEFENYLLRSGAEFEVNDTIKDIDCDDNTLYISLENMNYIISVDLLNGIPDHDTIAYNHPVLPTGGDNIQSNVSIAKDDLGLLVADYYQQRILRLSDTFNVVEYMGGYGNGEKEFIKPSIIRSFENRIFIYDEAEARNDIQVFDPLFNSITKIAYDITRGSDNYLAPEFLNDIVGMEIVTKEENNRIYYYALLLSKSSNKLAMLKLPQWEELRARVRSNKIVFLKDREILTAKPTGSDLVKIITTDSIPRISGTVDYPSISPDGRKIVFTSRVELYDATNQNTGEDGNIYAYDNLYMIDINGTNLQRIPLGSINNYEIERPVFSSNGDKIIFSAKETGKNWQIYIYSIPTGGIEKVFDTDENLRFPFYSPEDRYIVFTTDYDGDEEIEIIDINNKNVRISLTSNNARDSFPVWSRVYPYEISNPDLDITSKIAFVSEREYHKGVYYSYISLPDETDLRVVKKSGEETGNDPDSAAIEITTNNTEGDYPCFVGNAESIVYEFFDGYDQILNKYNHEDGLIEKMNLPPGSRKPAGMKNSISNFEVEPVNGNEVSLKWTPYVDHKTFYTLQFRINREGEPFVQKKVSTTGDTMLQGLEMGVEYLFKVSIVENGREEAATPWKKVRIPEVAAKPAYTIDENNPYLVKFHAWKPDEEIEWKFIWVIDNQEVATALTSQDLAYEFGTSGLKIVQLKVTNKANTVTAMSEPLFIDIQTDIKPVIEYVLIKSDTAYIELNAENSTGNKIDLSSASWTISGPGSDVIKEPKGTRVIVSLDYYKHKVNVSLKLQRKAVTGQQATDIIEKNIVIDLDIDEVKPVITYEIDKKNTRLFYFSGNYSLGNIDWYRAKWNVHNDGQILYTETGLSSFAYEFPETREKTNYSVSLALPRKADGQTVTTSIMVSVDEAPIEPVIDYEILELKEGNNVIGSKILFSCSGSKGNNVDFVNARWSVPVAGAYQEQPTQIGPTAIYNLINADSNVLVDVSLTLTKRGGTDPVTRTKIIQLNSGEIAQTEVIVNKEIEENESGAVIILDILSSTGPNIDWEKTEWVVDGSYIRKGTVCRYDVPARDNQTVFTYVVTVFLYGSSTPIIKRGEIIIDSSMISPFISKEKIPGDADNVYKLSITETPGVNIDWERTTWYIYDGNSNVNIKNGASIAHVFEKKNNAFGYPVMVEMFFKGSTRPFVGYDSIDIEGDELSPVITWDSPAERGDNNVIHFSAQSSKGSNIAWSQCKWTFGDSSESQYGPTAVHEYSPDSGKRDYRVSLTIIRKQSNGEEETKTAYKTISIASEEITPVIKATLNSNGYMVLSAEESEGRGLLLDRSLWLFEGTGDTENININEKIGTIRNENHSESESSSDSSSDSVGGSLTFSEGALFAEAEESASYNHTWSDSDSKSSSSSISTTSYDDYKDMTQAFSSSNTHTGAMCRKYVKDFDTGLGIWKSDGKRVITVTLFVYRVGADGGMRGRSITARVDLDEASKGSGVVYK